MGFIFQLCDRSLSKALEVEPVAYGEEPNPNPNPNPNPSPDPDPSQVPFVLFELPGLQVLLSHTHPTG